MMKADCYNSNFTACGTIIDYKDKYEGYITVKNGSVIELSDGECPDKPDFSAIIVINAINNHTHCADYGLHIDPNISIQQLVAPPNGIKHRYLSESPDSTIIKNMMHFSRDSKNFGSKTFVDFREMGAKGCNLLRSVDSNAIILGRPISDEFDPNEIDNILSIANGIGMSSISDINKSYLEAIADHVHKRNAIFAIHASERVREDIDFILSLDPCFIVHMCEATRNDFLKCADADIPIVICPRSNAYFGKVPKILSMLEQDTNIAIGTDNGMICDPDLRAEAASLISLEPCFGGHEFDIWNTFVALGPRLLGYTSRSTDTTTTKCLMIIPYQGKYSERAVIYSKYSTISLSL